MSDTEDVIEALEKAEREGKYFVAKVIRTTWSTTNVDAFVWTTGCSGCGKDMAEGEVGYVWGAPANPEVVDNEFLVLETHCSDECVTDNINDVSEALGFPGALVGYFDIDADVEPPTPTFSFDSEEQMVDFAKRMLEDLG